MAEEEFAVDPALEADDEVWLLLGNLEDLETDVLTGSGGGTAVPEAIPKSFENIDIV